jgi:hypothetical protein
LKASYGAGNVKVTGTVGEYTIAFKGALAEQPVALIRPGYAGLGTIAEIAAGHPSAPATDGEIYVTAENLGNANIDGAKCPSRSKTCCRRA